jgi:ankyrin repeat protein/beta-lactamase regulating signal transducer with metallopeptidase domain
MNALQPLLGAPLVELLGWTLLHFLWEGAFIGLAASLIFRFARGSGANTRYNLACLLLAACIVAPVITFVTLAWPNGHPGIEKQAGSNPSPAIEGGSSVQPWANEGAPALAGASVVTAPAVIGRGGATNRANRYLALAHALEAVNGLVRWLVPVWLLGVTMMGLRLATAWGRIQYWRWAAVPVLDAAAVDLFARLRAEMKFARRVTLLVCDRIHVPLTLGWLRPVILVPAQLLTGLAPEELRAILAHELSHIARYDYLVNLFQSVAEALLFYHPAIWSLSNKVREAREECCDEVAVQAGADRVVYANALADLAELSLASGPALGATGGSLFHRVARLLGRAQPEPAWTRNHAAWAVSLASATLIVFGILHSSKSRADVPPQTPVFSLTQKRDPSLKAQAKSLQDAVRKANVSAVRRLLGTGVSVEANPDLKDLVYYAVIGGNLEIFQLLLDHGMNINGPTPNNEGAFEAALDSPAEEVRFLIDHGVDVNYVDGQGTRACWNVADLYFFTPARLGHGFLPLAILDLLRQKGADFEGEDKMGATIFTFMLHVVPVDAQLPNGKVPSAADLQKDFEIQRRVIQIVLAGGADPNALDSWLHETPLINALEGGQHAAALALLDAGADVNKPDNQGNPPIVFSVLRRWALPVPIEALKGLLARSADPNSRTHGGSVRESLPKESTSVLELLLEQRGYGISDDASEQNVNEAFQLLLAHGAHFTGNLSPAVDRLLRAAGRGDLPGLQQAIADGASVSSADADGWTPLMVALSLGHDDCADWLIAQGANIKTKNAQGYSPLFFAVTRQQAQRVADFLTKGANPNCGQQGDIDGGPSTIGSALWLAAVHKNVPIFKMLVDAGAKVTPAEIVQAIQTGQVEMVKALLDKGSPPDSPNPPEHRGSVYWAVYYDQPEILKLLINHDADLEMKTDYNETPLSIARQWHKELVPILEAAIAKKHGKSATDSNNSVFSSPGSAILQPRITPGADDTQRHIDAEMTDLTNRLHLTQQQQKTETEPQSTKKS